MSYKVLELNVTKPKTIELQLNEMKQEGWELLHTVSPKTGSNSALFILGKP
ncbi:MAG: hypothetical protein ACW967_02215 [Candidatus Hodarchaeales archaeon]